MLNLQPHLSTEHVELCPLQTSDFERLYDVASDPEIWKQHPNKNRYQRKVFQTFFEGALQSGGAFIIIDKKTKQAIGSTRFYAFDEDENSIFMYPPYQQHIV